MVDEVPVAVDVGVEVAEPPEESPLGLGITRVELPHLGIEQVIEEQRSVFGALGRRYVRIKRVPLLGFLAGHKHPTDDLGICEDGGLDGFVFSGCRHP